MYLKEYDNKKNYSLITISIVFIIITLQLLVSYIFNQDIFTSNGIEFISLLFIIFYLWMIIHNKYKLLFLILVCELTLNVILCTYNQPDIKPSVMVKDACVIDDNSFFRANESPMNFSFYCGYGSISSYTTTSNYRNQIFSRRFGINTKVNWIDHYSFTTPIIDSLLSIKYYLDFNIAKNEDILPIGYMIHYKETDLSSHPLDVEQNILNTMINHDLVYFDNYDLDENNGEYSFINNGKPKYLLLRNSYKPKVTFNKENIQDYIRVKTLTYGGDTIIRINDITDHKIIINIDCGKKIKDCSKVQIALYDFNDEKFKDAINILKDQQLESVVVNKNTLFGKILVEEENQYLFFSIPYENGWNIYVDGKKVKYEKLFDNFIGIKLDKGMHSIKMRFLPKGLILGTIVSIISILSSTLYLIFRKNNNNTKGCTNFFK